MKLPAYDETRLNNEAVEAMEALQSVVEQARIIREKRNISLRTPIKSVVAIFRDPSENVINGITGPLKKYILSEVNAWDFHVVPTNKAHEWITLSLTPDFSILGRKLGKKMKAVQAHISTMTHEVRKYCFEDSVSLGSLTHTLTPFLFRRMQLIA